MGWFDNALVYYDRWVPGVSYMLVDGATAGTKDLLVSDGFDLISRLLFEIILGWR